MYYSLIYVTIAFLALLVPFSIPIKLKNPLLRRTRTFLLLGFIISCLITFTPDKAVHGAPLNFFGEAKITLFSCSSQIYTTQATFCAPDDPDFLTCYCSNPNARATMIACFDNISKNAQQNYLKACQQQYNVFLTDHDFQESLANYSKYAKDIKDLDGMTEGKLVAFPVKLDPISSMKFKDAYDQFLGNYDLSVIYGSYLVMFWFAVFAALSIANWSKLIFPNVHKQLVGPFPNWFRKTISSPATGGNRKTNEQPFLRYLDLLVPTRLETIVLSLFLLLTAYLAVNRIHYTEGNMVFKKKSEALLRFYAVRASILTSSMMPLLILFGGRNNFLQWLTRWDYSTFITFHRWLSRIIMVLITVHGIFYSLYTSDFDRFIREAYVQWGVLAIGCGFVILVQGLLVLRRKYYEVFLLLHIILAFGFIFGAYMHVMELYCLWFYHFTLAVWLFDRIVRIGRLHSFGFPKAKVYLLADEALKVVIPKPEHWEVIPGGHAFIHFIRPSCFWQSHPFTYTQSCDNEDEIIIFMKVKEGVTRHIYQYLLTHPNKFTEIRVGIEGSYGETTPASRYDSAVFVAGGNGIPGIYAEALDLAMRSTKPQVKLIWVVREYRSLFWFYEELLSLRDTHIETEVYVTKPTSHHCLGEFQLRFPSHAQSEVELSVIDESTSLVSIPPKVYGTVEGINGDHIINNIKQELSFISFKEGRPNIDQIVKETIKESSGSVAYITCGHPIMVDDLRASVVNNIDNREHKRIDYFEQLQVWA